MLPASIKLLLLILRQGGREAALAGPGVLDIGGRGKGLYLQPSKISRTERRGFDDHGAQYRPACHISQKLADPVVPHHAAVDADFIHRMASVISHGVDQVE